MLPISQKVLLMSGAACGLISVAMGAFGAHALKGKLTPEMLNTFEVGVRYQMYHSLAIFAAVWISTLMVSKWAIVSAWLFFSGILIFSGSLYLLTFTGLRFLGAITPIGGLLLLLGWGFLMLAIANFKN